MMRFLRKSILPVITVLMLPFLSFSQVNWVNNGNNLTIGAGSYLIVSGDFINQAGGSVTNNGKLELAGDFENDAVFQSGSGSEVTLNGGSQTIGGTQIATIANLIIDGTDDKSLLQELRISEDLNFVVNKFDIGNFALRLLQGSTISGAGANNYIITSGTGYLYRHALSASSPALFAVGTNLGYKPLELDFTGVSDTFNVRVADGISPTTGFDQSCVQSTWLIEEGTNGGNTCSLNLAWNTAHEGSTFNRTIAHMNRYDNGSWIVLNGTPGALVNTPATDWDYSTGNIQNLNSLSNKFIVTNACMMTAQVSNDTSICAGDQVSLSASGGTQFSWSTSSSASSITVSPSVTTTYTVTVTDGPCTASEDIVVSVLPAPQANAGSDTSVCAGYGIDLTATGGTSYLWSGGQSTATINVVPTVNTTYTVTVSVGSCTATDAVEVDVNPSPSASAFEATTICFGSGTKITAYGGGAYLWNTGDTVSQITVAPAVTTTYTVTVTNAWGCTDTASLVIGVVPNPVIDLGPDSTICINHSLSLDAGAGYNTYIWSTGDTLQTSMVDSSGFGAPGTYPVWVQVVDSFGCAGYDTVNITFAPCTFIPGQDEGIGFSIFPNPNRGSFTIEISETDKKFEMEIINLNGQVIMQKTLYPAGGLIRDNIQLYGIARGVYLVKARNDKHQYIKRLIIH